MVPLSNQLLAKLHRAKVGVVGPAFRADCLRRRMICVRPSWLATTKKWKVFHRSLRFTLTVARLHARALTRLAELSTSEREPLCSVLSSR